MSMKPFLNNGYKKNKKQNIQGYYLDKNLSGNRVQVYHNPTENKTLINHKGSSSTKDFLITDPLLGVGKLRRTDRYQHSKKIQQLAEEKYKNSQITTIGHSLGGSISEKLNLDPDNKTITYNKGSSPFVQVKTKNTQTDIRKEGDPISYFSKYDEGEGKQKTIDNNIIGKLNPITSHQLKTISDKELNF